MTAAKQRSSQAEERQEGKRKERSPPRFLRVRLEARAQGRRLGDEGRGGREWRPRRLREAEAGTRAQPQRTNPARVGKSELVRRAEGKREGEGGGKVHKVRLSLR